MPRYETRAERRRRFAYYGVAALYLAAVAAMLIWGLWGYGLADPSAR